MRTFALPSFFMSASNYYTDIIETQRLATRLLCYDDHSIWIAFMADPVAIRFLPQRPDSTIEEQSLYWIERQLKRYRENTFGLQALIHKDTGNMIGQCGLLLQEFDGKTETEIGYHIFPEYWGQGYATEAARAFKQYAFENHLAESLVSVIDIHNYASQKVAEKNGMHRDSETMAWGFPEYVYRVRKEDIIIS